MKKSILLLAALFVMTSCGKEEPQAPTIEKHPVEVIDGQFTPEIMHQLGKISDLQISPSGEKVLYGVTYTDIALNKGQRHLYLMNVDGTDNKQITHFAKSVSNARWIDDTQIAFIMGGQIYVWNMANGGEPVKISDVEGTWYPIFTRDVYTVYCEVPISFAQAALGAEIQVPTLDGRVPFEIPEGTQTGTVFTLKGKGIPVVGNSRRRGDQKFTVVLETPTRLSKEQKEMLRQLEESMDETPKRKKFFNLIKDLFD